MPREIKTFDNITNKNQYVQDSASSKIVSIGYQPIAETPKVPVEHASFHEPFTMNARKPKRGPIMQALVDFDNYIWEKGQETPFFGMKDMYILPSEEWTEGESDSYTVNFLTNIKDAVKSAFVSEPDNDEPTVSIEYDDDTHVKFDPDCMEPYKIYNDPEILSSDEVPAKFTPSFIDEDENKMIK